MSDKKKSPYLTIYMIILSVLVIMIHNQTLDILGKRIIYSEINKFLISVLTDGVLDIAVPGFFFISGYLHFRKFSVSKYGTMLKTKARTLLVPYILWNFVGFVYAYCVSNFEFLKQFSCMEEVELSLQTIFEALFLHKYNTVGWYLLSLMFLMILSPVIEICINKKYKAIVCVLVLLVYYTFFYNCALIRDFGTLSFVLGGIVGKDQSDIAYKEKIIPVNSLTAAILFIVIAVLRMWITSKESGNIILLVGNHVLRLVLLTLLWNLVGMFAKKIKETIVNYSFPIYVMHWYVLSIVQKIFVKIIPANNITVWIIFIGSTIITTVVIILLAKLWRKLFPRLYVCFMGGR